MRGLKGKRIVLTGGASGIGHAIALRLGEEGCTVGILDLNGEGAPKVADEIVAAGGRAIAVQADVARLDDVRALFAACDRELGMPTALINNAAVVGARRDIADVDADFLRQIFTTNVDSVFFCVGEAVRRMSTRRGGRGGVILNISSAAARRCT